MRFPMVSVILPCYNGEQYLRQCLDSILGQTLKEIEILCVDAGSTDASLPILLEYARRDHRVTVLTGYGRLDAGTARNIGLERASGEYLAFLDADDYFKAEMLEDTYGNAKANGADIVVFYARQLNMRNNILSDMPWSLKLRRCPRHSPFAPVQMRKYLFNSFENWTWNKLFRAGFIKEHNIRFQQIPRTNDMAFTCEALARAARISCLPKVYATYRIGTGTSLQQTNDLSPTCFWEAYKETRNRLTAAGVYETYQQSFLNTVLTGTMYNLSSVKTEEARREILRLIREEVGEFGLAEHPETYYYSPWDYQQFLRIQNGGEPEAEPLSGLRASLRELTDCWSGQGSVYTCKYILRKISHKLTRK